MSKLKLELKGYTRKTAIVAPGDDLPVGRLVGAWHLSTGELYIIYEGEI